MDTIENNNSILDFFEINHPLKESSVNDKKNTLNVKLNNTNLFEIQIIDKNTAIFTIQFNQNFKIISPSLNEIENKYSINYSKLPLYIDDIEDLRFIIIEINKVFIVFNINFSHNYSISVDNKKSNNLTLNFTNNHKFKININTYEKLEYFYSQIKIFNSLFPEWILGLGIMFDFKKKSGKDVFFAGIKEKLNINNIFFILKNWEDQNNLLKPAKDYINNFDAFLQKLLLNDIKFLLQYNNTIPINASKKINVIHMRNGKHASTNNRVMIDYYNSKGQLSLADIYKNILSIKSSGIYLYPAYNYFNDKDIYEKSICKNENILIPYSRNVQMGIKIINAIIKNISSDDYIFFTNMLSMNMINGVFLKHIDEDINKIIEKIEDYYRQGFINFGVYITNKNLSFLLKSDINIFLLLLIPMVVVFEFDLITYLINNDESLKNQFIEILNLKLHLKTLFDNIILDFINNGILPFVIYRINNDISGFFLGDYLYCSFIKERLLDSIISIPEGKWYNWTDNIIIYGTGNYSLKHNKNLYHLFQKEGTIVFYINDKNIINPNKIKFIIFPIKKSNNTEKSYNFKSIKKIISERNIVKKKCFKINHDIKFLLNMKNKMILKYSSKNIENIDRTIIFHIVTEEIKINDILCNEKKVFFHQDNSAFIEFELINKTNNFNIEINYT